MDNKRDTTAAAPGFPIRRERSFHASTQRTDGVNSIPLRRERSFADPPPPFHGPFSLGRGLYGSTGGFHPSMLASCMDLEDAVFWNEYEQHFMRARELRQCRLAAAMPVMRGKPAMELYRPPTLRSSSVSAASGSVYSTEGLYATGDAAGVDAEQLDAAAAAAAFQRQQLLNADAKEFQPTAANGGVAAAATSPSKRQMFPLQDRQNGAVGRNGNHQSGASNGRQQQRDAKSLKGRKQFCPAQTILRSKSSRDTRAFKVTFGPDGDAPASGDDSVNYAPPPTLRRSRSMGVEMCATLRSQPPPAHGSASLLDKLGHFNPDVQKLAETALQDPSRLSGRSAMELVRHLFTRLVESTRYAEPTARYCLAVADRERNETFMETLINTCQEWFQQRDRLMRSHQTSYSGGFVPASPRWIAFVTFVIELYTALKRRHLLCADSVGGAGGPAAAAMTGSGFQQRAAVRSSVSTLLQLLTECCLVTLRSASVNSLAETECVFLVMTSIGRDLENELPSQLDRILSGCRDALLNCALISTVSKTLLQLVELHAARWQLPAPTVMYYYPMSAK